VPGTIGRQEAARLVEFYAVAYRREKIENFAVVFDCVAHAIGGKQRQTEGASNADSRLITRFLCTILVALQLHEDAASAENSHEPLDYGSAFRLTASGERRSEWAFIAACETN
jgi:hypothetical protein